MSTWLVHVLEKLGMIEESLATARTSCLRHSETENSGGGTDKFSTSGVSVINILEIQWLKKSLHCPQQPAGNGAFSTIRNSQRGYLSAMSPWPNSAFSIVKSTGVLLASSTTCTRLRRRGNGFSMQSIQLVMARRLSLGVGTCMRPWLDAHIAKHQTSGVTTNRLKPQWSVKPPKGWEEHMFFLRDRRCSLTPLASSTGASHLPSSSMHQQGQIHNENTMTDKVQESIDDEDGLKSNNKEGSEEGSKGSTKGSDYAENKESLSDCEKGGDTCTPNARPASGVHSPLPPSLLLADWTDDSGPNAEETVASPHQGCQMYWRLQKKGKGRALDTEDVDLADHSDHEMPLPYLKKPGNLSKVALEEIWAFVWDVKMTAQELEQWHGQSTCDILITVGFGVKPSHTKINEANLFHSWYWAMQPKPAGVNRDTLNNLITKEYNTLMQDIPKDDLATRREKLQAVYEWSESSSVLPANQSVKSITTRVNSTKMQFSGLAEAWSDLKDIKIIGVVMNGDGTEAGLLSTGSAGDAAIALELCCCIKETPRDCNHRVFRSMMKEKLLAALKDLHCGQQGSLVAKVQGNLSCI
ncbi:hypothetical protein F5141DRAFT_1061648 [Pisolithus sp. B1]|nr:hypothetical protein F5141DRAFT_1061648 [Pisolithus sp. B1]